MHALSFGLKRAHLCTVEVLKKMAKEFDLTPSRFDVLFVLRTLDGGGGQSELWTLLGVSRQTMSKMLKGMEDKGLIWRDRDPDDRRRRSVVLTKLGLERFVAAAKVLFRTDKLRGRFDGMHPEGRVFVEKVSNVVRHVGKALHDTARHYYSVHEPDAETIEAADKLNARVYQTVQRLEAQQPKIRALSPERFRELSAIDEELIDPQEWNAFDLQRTLNDLERDGMKNPSVALRAIVSRW